MKSITLKGRPHSTVWSTVLAVIALFLLGGIHQAQAQWSQPDPTTGNINSTNTGNVGIGTSAPNTLLEINKSQNSGTSLIIDNGYTAAGNGAYSGYWLKQAGVARFFLGSINDNNAVQIGGPAAIQFWNFANGPMLIATNNTERMRIAASGNVGIGMTNPQQQLDVGGSLAINGATVIDNNRIFSARSSFNTYTADGVWNTQAKPSTIFTPSSYINTGFFFGYEDEASGQYTPSLGISTPPNASANTRVLQLRQFGGSSPEGYNRFEMNVSGKLSWGSGTSAPNISISRASDGSLALNAGTGGSVGITGNTTVTGTFTATAGITGTTINATYQDVAEWVPATHALAAGTVVVLNPTKSNEVMASQKAYDTGVAGVISPRPGLTLGEAGKDKALVATTGRVKVKVDATRAPIHVGDLLVTSDEEGVAMKSVPVNVGGVEMHRPGTLIGKALEPLESGRGEILVLLSLQ